jgi:class 3 adenylate cyclase/tetratricopeptide (TPR) repeat protein
LVSRVLSAAEVMALECASCGVRNDASQKFCGECGERLLVACPGCGTLATSPAKFCGECGTGLRDDVARPVRTSSPTSGTAARTAEEVTERKLVSVLFVDLVGSTSYAENHDAEDVRAMLGRYFEEASDAVEQHGGVVEKFIGDAVMAVWGTPVAHEDDAERAVRSALDVVDRVQSLGIELGVPLRARAGVLTGEAVATVGAFDQNLVAGDLVNTASRLQSAAKPGTVLVGDRTQRAAGNAILFTRVDDLSVKGKAEPLPAWRVDRVVGQRGGSGRGSTPEPPFVGRDEELRLAKELVQSTSREGRPKLLTLIGVGGIGKSRLVWELRKYIDGLMDVTYWHQGRCPAYGDGVSFWALSEMVRSRAGIADTDSDDEARQRLAACLEDYVSDADERRWIAPRIGHLLGLDPAPPGDREELFGAWRRFFERVAERGGVLLVFEDLHWADAGLLDFIESLLEWSRSSPILVMALARPELAERRPNWGAGVRYSTTIHVDRLPDDAIRTMVTGYVDGLPEDGLTRLVQRTEGVPLYAVETVRMLADRGVLEQLGERYHARGELGGELEIPETLHALVAARLDGLPDAERSLVQDAAVAGHSFTPDTLTAVSGRSNDELEPLLRSLMRKEVLEKDIDPRSPERGQYQFVQSVIQEVAYSTLSKGARRAKHLNCAEYLSQLGDDDLVGVVANHYLEAFLAEPAANDAEEVGGRARTWLGLAADRAFSLGSPEQALGFVLRAQPLATSPADRAALLATAATAAGNSGDFVAATAYLREASDAYRADDDVAGEARLLAKITYDVNSGNSADRDWVTHRRNDLEARLRDTQSSERALLLAALSMEAAMRGQSAEALASSELALALADKLQDDSVLVRAAQARAWALQNDQRHWEAARLLDGILVIARKNGSALETTQAMLSIAIFMAEDDPRGSVEVWLEAIEIARRSGIRPMQALLLANAAELAAGLGDWDLAESMLAEADGIGTSSLTSDKDELQLTRIMILAARGDRSEAARLTADVGGRIADDYRVPLRAWFRRIEAYQLHLANELDAAFAAAWTAVEQEPSGMNAPMGLWVGIQIAIGLHDADRVSRLLELSAGLRGRWIAAVRTTALAAIAAMGGDVAGAAERFADALRQWEVLDLPLDHAITAIAACEVLPVELRPSSDVVRAREFLASVQGIAHLRLLEAASN